ncbi:MAG: type II secretion system secretin GspD [Methylococcaceae bacterium]
MNMKTNKFKIVIAMSAMLALTGCEYLWPQKIKKNIIEDAFQKPDHRSANKSLFKKLDNSGKEKKQKELKPEIHVGTGKFLSSKTNNSQSKRPSGAKGKYRLNFDDADLGEVAKVILSDTLGANYILSPRVAGRVTLQTTKELTKEELLPTLEMLLEMNNAALVKSASGVYRIEPAATAQQGASVRKKSGSKPLRSGYQIRVFPLEYVGVQDMVEILNPILPPKAVTRVDTVRNMLVIAGTSQQLSNIQETIELFDVNMMDGMSFGLFPMKNAEATKVVEELDGIFSKDAKVSNPFAGMFRFLPIERLNSVLVVTQQPEYLDAVQDWVKRLDKAQTEGGGGGVVVYHVQNVDALELADTLTSIFGGASSSPRKDPSVAGGLQGQSISNRKDNKNKKKETRRGAKKAGQGTGQFEGISIIADEGNNSLIIMANPQQYGIIKQIVLQLDIMPLQVLIDAKIISVDLKDDLQYGVKWLFENRLSGSYDGQGGLFGIGETLVNQAADVAATGFTYGVLNKGSDVRIILEALATDSLLNVISTPSLMVLNNKEAKIHVGDSVPIRTNQSQPTNTLVPTNTGLLGNNNNAALSGVLTSGIQMLDTGIDLTVTPRVNSSGLVIMEVAQQFNNAIPSERTSGIDSPTIQEKEITSTVAVHDGETLVLGGLISDNENESKTGIPLLSKIPLIGSLFSSTTKSYTKSELIILITPRVVARKEDARDITNEYKRRLLSIYGASYNSPAKNKGANYRKTRQSRGNSHQEQPFNQQDLKEELDNQQRIKGEPDDSNKLEWGEPERIP